MEWYMFVILAIEVIASYFLGNISIARILSKFNKGDITKEGSGNPGATNMLRAYGAKFGFLTLILDALKGVLPALMGYLTFLYVDGGNFALVGLYACGLNAVIGHMFPVCYKFKGGKGVSTTLGVFAVADPLIMLFVFIGAFIYVIFFEYVSVASLLLVTAMSIVEVYKIPDTLPAGISLTIRVLIFVLFTLVWFAHRQNIQRLLVGKENKANLKKALQKVLKQEKKAQKQIKKAEHKASKQIKKAEHKELKAIKKAEHKAYKLTQKAEHKEYKHTHKVERKGLKQIKKAERKDLKTIKKQNKKIKNERDEKL